MRLNGFLLLENFIVHPTPLQGKSQRTDADVFGVRFPFRRELSFADDQEHLRFDGAKPCFVIAEVKIGNCDLNGPWTKPEKENMQYVLRAIGAFEASKIDEVARSLYQTFRYEDNDKIACLLSIGKERNAQFEVASYKPLQITFAEILEFIFLRFTQYQDRKNDHQQWDPVGHRLWQEARQFKHDKQGFIASVLAKLV